MAELESIWQQKPHVPDELKKLFNEYPFGSVRVAILEGCKPKKSKKGFINQDIVKLVKSKYGQVSLRINTEKYVARVGDLYAGGKLGPLEMSLEQHGSVSLISLDDLPLSSSECALLTIAGPTMNTDMGIEYQSGRKNIDGIGHWPPLLRVNKGMIKIDTQQGRDYRLVPVSLKPGLTDVAVKPSNGHILLKLEQQKTPWYILTSNGCDRERVYTH